MENIKWTRNCPKCQKLVEYKNKYTYLKSENNNKICGYCSRQKTGIKNKDKSRTQGFKENLALKMKDHPSLKNNPQRNSKISKKLKGRDTSYIWGNYKKETIQCLTCNNIVESQKHRSDSHHFCNKKCQKEYYFNNKIWKPKFNPKACSIIEEYGKMNGYNFQHALNGGEYRIKKLNYWVDGYDIEKNIVIEYNEKHHIYPLQKEKDKIRRENIIKTLKCKFIIIYYNQNIEIYE